MMAAANGCWRKHFLLTLSILGLIAAVVFAGVVYATKVSESRAQETRSSMTDANNQIRKDLSDVELRVRAVEQSGERREALLGVVRDEQKVIGQDVKMLLQKIDRGRNP